MSEHEPLVLSYSHLGDLPRGADALHTLKKIASLVKPIMRTKRWKVGELAEFYPDQQNLLGLNINRGSRILLRLRYPGDRSQFLPTDQVIDTMLHELSHIVHGPHDHQFHALWNELRDQYTELVIKGYTGEGFLVQGHRVGGSRMPGHEKRRLARAAAEKRRPRAQASGSGSGRRLGGAGPLPGHDIRNVIANAADRRRTVLEGCGNDGHGDIDIDVISETATRNGFRTKAEEDEANDRAIAQALWELVREEEEGDEERKANGAGVPRTQSGPVLGSGVAGDQELLSRQTRQGRADAEDASGGAWWACNACTLRNPDMYLCCDACGTERAEPNAVGKARVEKQQAQQQPRKTQQKRPKRPSSTPAVAGPTGSSSLSGQDGKPASVPPEPAPPPTWMCSFCGSIMAREWWTCSACGKMKDSSG